MTTTVSDAAARSRVALRVTGVVQGVGFRPFLARLARELGLGGFAGNDGHGVFVEAEGSADAVDRFVAAIRDRPPPLARVDQVTSAAMPTQGDGEFVIVASRATPEHDALVTADAATCDECLRELFDPADRRFRYAFTNCTNCGPRYTIVCDVPYDRARTTMARFAMCAACQAEYEDPSDRRYHAEPVCCPVCGPRLAVVEADGREIPGDPIEATTELLEAGLVVAVKGLGGYHLAVDATNEAAVAELRRRKHREERPFALMVRDLDAARKLAEVGPQEEELLCSPARPIVLLRRRADPGIDVAAAVAPRQLSLGLMLPYTPLHHLLLAGFDGPLVMTSGNASDDPIAFDDADAMRRLAGIADAFCRHDRPIRTRVDDSVVRVVGGRPQPVRRSRGHAPAPLRLPVPAAVPVLGVGAQLKNTVCLARGDRAFVSQHVGDLDSYETFTSYLDTIERLRRLFDIAPAVLAHDLHPDYRSTAYAEELAVTEGLRLVGVQHHHAHIASCLADNGHDGRVVGVSWDGTGYGTDGTLWGGEFLVADLADAVRVGRLAPVAMPGGEAAIRAPWRMAASYADAASLAGPATEPLRRRHPIEWNAVVEAARSGTNAPLTSSAGRLFDAIASLLDVRDVVTYEGQAAIELEQLCDPEAAEAFPIGIRGHDGLVEVDGAGAVRAVCELQARGVPAATVAARFHNSLAAVAAEVCERIGSAHGLETVALSGGVFGNARLTTTVRALLEARGFTVLTHRQVPANDGGISLGQAAVAAARS